MQNPLSVIKAVERFIRAEVGMGTMGAEASCAANIQVLVTRLRALVEVTMDDSTEVLEYTAIDNGTFNLHQRREISDVVKAMVRSSDRAAPAGRRGWQMQKHQFLHFYLTARLWAALFSRDTVENKMKLLAVFMLNNLGLHHPDTETKRLAIVVILIASNIECGPQQCYDHFHEFGRIMDQKRTSCNTSQTKDVFPEQVADFVRIYPEAYGPDDPPVECRIDVTTIPERMRPDLFPARYTNDNVDVPTRRLRRTCKRAQPSVSPIVETQPRPPHPMQHANTDGDLAVVLRRAFSQPTFDAAQFQQYHPAYHGQYQGPPPLTHHGQHQGALTYHQEPPPPITQPPLGANAASAGHAIEIPGGIITGGIAPRCLQAPPTFAPAQGGVLAKLAALKRDVNTTAVVAPTRVEDKDKESGEEEAEWEEEEEEEGEEEDAEEDEKEEKADKDKNAAAPKKRKTSGEVMRKPAKGNGAGKGKGTGKGKGKGAHPIVAEASKVAMKAKAVAATKPKAVAAPTSEERKTIDESPLKFSSKVPFGKRLRLALLLKRPAACKRPKFNSDGAPVVHHGGRIHWVKKNN